MVILAIDYGQKKIGLAISRTPIAEPFSVVRFSNKKEAVEKIKRIVEKEKVEKIVVGFSPGKIGEETKQFVQVLKKGTGLPIVFQDESLTTKRAIRLSIQAGIKRKKRKNMEDAYSAALILQEFLDS